MSESLLSKIKAFAELVGSDVESAWDRFEAWFKSEETPKVTIPEAANTSEPPVEPPAAS